MEQKFLVTSSPHVGTHLSARRIMQVVLFALLPSFLAGVINFGYYSILVVGVSVLAAFLTEYLFCIIYKKPNSTTDLSAVVTGMILGLNMPPTVSLYVPAVGAVFAIFIVKMLFGGIGKNFANPAAAARVFCLLSFSGAMTAFAPAKSYSEGFFKGFFHFDTITSATPLISIKEAAEAGLKPNLDLIDLFFGSIGGSIGEISAFAILVGGAILLFSKVIHYRKPLIFLSSIAVFTLIFYKNGIYYILPTMLSGGVMFAAFFMITDYSSGPSTPWGTVIYAAGIAFFTVLIRRFGAFPEGVSIAILLMNVITPTFDKLLIPKPFGYRKPKAKKEGV